MNWAKQGSKPSGAPVIWQLADGTYAVAVTNEGIAYSTDLLTWTLEALERDPLRIENITEGNGIWVANHTLQHPGGAWSEDEGRTWHGLAAGFLSWTAIQIN